MKAFPLKSVNMFDDNEGMDLRDYFAAKAMQGMMADHTRDNYPEEYAKHAYRIADAMMKEREK
jgi:DNA-directed RNA polymerase specialized sigma subunit